MVLQAAWRKVIGKGLVLSIEHHYDEDTYWDGSYGTWSDKASTVVYGDRKLGVLRGPAHTFYETLKTEDAADQRIAELEEEDYGGQIVWSPTRVYYQITDTETARTYYHSQPFETERAYDEWRNSMWNTYGSQYGGVWYIMEETRREWRIEVYGDEILSRDGFNNNYYDGRTYRYWLPANNYFSDMPDYPDVTQADCISYFLRDWTRIEGMGEDWSYIFVDAIVALDGEEIGQSSLGGVEDDGEGDYLTEIETSVISDALTNALAYFDGSEPPAELVALEKLTYDELKPLRALVKDADGNGESLEEYLYDIEDEEDEDYAVYIGAELEGEDDAGQQE